MFIFCLLSMIHNGHNPTLSHTELGLGNCAFSQDDKLPNDSDITKLLNGKWSTDILTIDFDDFGTIESSNAKVEFKTNGDIAGTIWIKASATGSKFEHKISGKWKVKAKTLLIGIELHGATIYHEKLGDSIIDKSNYVADIVFVSKDVLKVKGNTGKLVVFENSKK